MSRVNGHEERISAALATAFQREGRAVIETNTPMTFAEMLEAPPDGAAEEREELTEKIKTAVRLKYGSAADADVERLLELQLICERRALRREALVWELFFIFQDGPHPGCTTRLLYLLAQRLAPELVLNMNGAELADLFGETRAAWSARNKRIFTGYLKARGAKAAKGRMEKSDTASAKYASAARGNTNRRGKFKRAA